MSVHTPRRARDPRLSTKFDLKVAGIRVDTKFPSGRKGVTMIDPKTSMEWLRFFFAPGRLVNPWHQRNEEADGESRLVFVWAATGIDFAIYASALSTRILSNPLDTGVAAVILFLRLAVGWWALNGLAHLKVSTGSFAQAGVHAKSSVWMAAATFAGFRHYELLVTRVIRITTGDGILLEQLLRGFFSVVFLACIAAIVAAPKEQAPVLARQHS